MHMKMKRNNKTDARPGEKGARSFHRSFGMAVLSVFAAVAVALFGAAPALADTTGPTISKTVEPLIDANQNVYGGTITLSVTGSASSTTTHTNANVIFVVDVSNSMNDTTGGYTLQPSDYGAYDDKGNDLYYLDTDWFGYQHYYRVSDSWGLVTGTVYTKDSATGAYSEYTGARYDRRGVTRLDAAKKSVKSAASTILDQKNTKVSLVKFGTNATPVLSQTDDIDSFNSSVDQLSIIPTNGGTNWEAGLSAVNRLVSSDPNTSNYVIFVSDGNPTFRDSANGYERDYKSQYGVYGTGNSDPKKRNFNAANTVAKNLIEDGVTLYNINAFGEAANMQDLGSPDSKYFNASDPAALQTALSQIVRDIVNAHSYRSVVMKDTISDAVIAKTADGNLDASSVTVTVKNKDNRTVALTKNADGSYSYASDDKTKTFSGPTVSGKTVTWSLDYHDDQYQLEDGWTYTASFDVKLTQATLNNAAKLLNDGTLASDPNMTVEDGVVKACTNTASGNDVSYIEQTTVNNVTIEERDHKDFTRPTIPVLTASNFTVSKLVSGGAANKTQDFTFEITANSAINHTYNVSGGSDGETVVFKNGKATMTLHHGQSKKIIGLPVGTTLTVEETGLSGNAKTSTTAKVDNGSAETVKAETSTATETDPVSVTLQAQAYTIDGETLVAPTGANTVEFTNNSTLVPQTGIKIDPLPMVVLLGVAVAGGVAVAAGVRKNHGREE